MQTRVSDQAAVILRRRDWRNTSLILELLTLDYGRVSLLARGARGAAGKVSYQPFALLAVGWSGRQELKTLTSIDATALPVDEQNYLALLYVNELISSFLPLHEPSQEVFESYLALLQQAVAPLGEVELREFELELMQCQGYFPDIGRDARSGDPIETGRHYRFEINNGFVACEQAAANSVEGAVILDWGRGDFSDDRVRRLAKSVLRSTIDFNLQGKTLKSRDVYLEIMRRK